jgi:hypothetical protein
MCPAGVQRTCPQRLNGAGSVVTASGETAQPSLSSCANVVEPKVSTPIRGTLNARAKIRFLIGASISAP